MYCFGDELKDLRIRKKLSQQQVADKLGITKTSVCAYERNGNTPRLEHLIALALLYDTSIDYIVGLEKRTPIYIDKLTKVHQNALKDYIEILIEENKNH